MSEPFLTWPELLTEVRHAEKEADRARQHYDRARGWYTDLMRRRMRAWQRDRALAAFFAAACGWMGVR